MILSVSQQYQATEVTDPTKNTLIYVYSIYLIKKKKKSAFKFRKRIRFLTYFIPMELASLNCKNDIDVIVNQFFRELTKRWMLLQNKTKRTAV